MGDTKSYAILLLWIALAGCGGDAAKRRDAALVGKAPGQVDTLALGGLDHPRRDSILAAQNNPGSFASDFAYRDADGVTHRLYAIDAPYTLLYIHNPECQACKAMKAALAESKVIAAAAASGRLHVLALYIDADTALWRRHLPDMPPGWHNGTDIGEYLYLHNVYDVRAIPTLYLLDQDKRVLLKDVLDVRKLTDFLTEK